MINFNQLLFHALVIRFMVIQLFTFNHSQKMKI